MKTRFFKIFLLSLSLVLFGASCSLPGMGNDDENKTSGPAGMFVTTDKGESWKKISTFPTPDGVKTLDKVNVYQIFEDPQDPDTMYWATRGNGLYYTHSKGQSWRKVNGPLSSGFIYSVAVHPKDKCLIYATGGSYVYKSEDCMRTWEKVYQESRGSARIHALEFSQFPPYQLYMGKHNGDFLVSKDAGASWTVLNRFGQNINKIIASKQNKDRIYLASNDLGLQISNDRADNWNNLTKNMSDFPGADDYHRVWVHPGKEGVIYWASDYGIIKSTDAGKTWSGFDLITSPGSANIWSMAVDPNNNNKIYYTATINNRSTFYYTIDGGKSWATKELPTGQVPTQLRVHPEENNVIYAGFSAP
jgi:photosystem II stability/assembly factor-like uncharacterized protein